MAKKNSQTFSSFQVVAMSINTNAQVEHVSIDPFCVMVIMTVETHPMNNALVSVGIKHKKCH